MTRPVRGFMTKHGNFFSTKTEAALHEATTDFHEALSSHLQEAGLSNTVLDFIMDKTREFVLIHKDAVRAYITLMQSIPETNTNDIRSVLLQPTTGPVPDHNPNSYLDNPEPMEGGEIDEDFVSAFSETMGEDDGPREVSGDDALDRQLGEST